MVCNLFSMHCPSSDGSPTKLRPKSSAKKLSKRRAREAMYQTLMDSNKMPPVPAVFSLYAYNSFDAFANRIDRYFAMKYGLRDNKEGWTAALFPFLGEDLKELYHANSGGKCRFDDMLQCLREKVAAGEDQDRYERMKLYEDARPEPGESLQIFSLHLQNLFAEVFGYEASKHDLLLRTKFLAVLPEDSRVRLSIEIERFKIFNRIQPTWSIVREMTKLEDMILSSRVSLVSADTGLNQARKTESICKSSNFMEKMLRPVCGSDVCKYCRLKGHSILDCYKFNGRCFNCRKVGHSASVCVEDLREIKLTERGVKVENSPTSELSLHSLKSTCTAGSSHNPVETCGRNLKYSHTSRASTTPKLSIYSRVFVNSSKKKGLRSCGGKPIDSVVEYSKALEVNNTDNDPNTPPATLSESCYSTDVVLIPDNVSETRENGILRSSTESKCLDSYDKLYEDKKLKIDRGKNQSSCMSVLTDKHSPTSLSSSLSDSAYFSEYGGRGYSPFSVASIPKPTHHTINDISVVMRKFFNLREFFGPEEMDSVSNEYPELFSLIKNLERVMPSLRQAINTGVPIC